MSRVDTVETASDAGATLEELVALGASEPHGPSRPVWHGDGEPRERFFMPAVLAAASALVAAWPYTTVIAPGAWSLATIVVIAAVALVGFGMRLLLRYQRLWMRETGALLGQIVAAIGLVTLQAAGGTAIMGVVPTGTTMRTFGALGASAWEQVVFGSAPLESTPGLAFLMAAGFAVLTILLDQLIAVRGAILASVLIGTVGAVPMIVTFADADAIWFVMLALMVLLLLRSTAQRHPESPRRDSWSTAIGVGAAAVVATLVVAPVVPVSATSAGVGVGVSVDASLRLGDDLRQPNPVEVLTLVTSASTAPYLRLTTLSNFDGRVWTPDQGALQPSASGFGAAEWGDDIALTEQSTSIRVLRMSSSWLPLPYPATGVDGVGTAWMAMLDNRTLFSESADAVGSDYTVSSLRVAPTLEQIRAISAAAAPAEEDPVELPTIIAQTAEEVTADSATDYDRLIAMQSWFRTQFTYSLDTPVDEDFDGTGAEAVAKFLEVRSGYCVHFAGAFALMAQSLGMQTRIVVGYRPGTRTQEMRGDDAVYSVTSDQLHSWPEVLFPGIGWVPFEPTATLGTPTGFSSATAAGGSDDSPTTAPTAAPTEQQTAAPETDRPDTGTESSGSSGQQALDPMPVLLTILGILLVLLLPMLVRLGIRSVRLGRARRGDAASAWTEVRATLIDLDIEVSDADSPRMRASALVVERGADADAMRTLSDAVERASYARTADPADLAAPLSAVLRSLRHGADRTTRLRAWLLPRSLVVGSSPRVRVR